MPDNHNLLCTACDALPTGENVKKIRQKYAPKTHECHIMDQTVFSCRVTSVGLYCTAQAPNAANNSRPGSASFIHPVGKKLDDQSCKLHEVTHRHAEVPLQVSTAVALALHSPFRFELFQVMTTDSRTS